MELKTFDELAALQDSALASRMRAIRHLIDQARQRSYPTRFLEVELCYAQREFEIRATRAKIHASRR